MSCMDCKKSLDACRCYEEVTDTQQANMALMLDDKVDTRIAHSLLRLFSPLGNAESNINRYDQQATNPYAAQGVLVGVMQHTLTSRHNNPNFDMDVKNIVKDMIRSAP